MFFREYHPNGPSEDPRPLSVIRAGRGLEHVEHEIEKARVAIENAINDVAVVLDNYGMCKEDDRRLAVAAAHEALDDMASDIKRRLEDEANG